MYGAGRSSTSLAEREHALASIDTAKVQEIHKHMPKGILPSMLLSMATK